MIRWTIAKAVLVAVSLLILAQVLYVGVLVKISYHEQLRLMLLASPAFAAFVAAYLAPSRKWVAGLSMSVFGAAIGILSSLAYEHFGLHVDRIGGLLTTFIILFAYQSALSFLGSAAGVFLSKETKGGRNTAMTP